MFNFGSDDVNTATVRVAPLEASSTGDPQLIRVPIDANDPFHYYTVEYRRKVGTSLAIPEDIVLIHEVKGGLAYLQLDGTGTPVQSLDTNGVQITVRGHDDSVATVDITASVTGDPARTIFGPNTCALGWVWREADDSDYVCVSADTRSQTWADNAAAPSRWVDGPYGPHTCIDGYVWREAFPGDDVCVTDDVRSQAWADNAAAPSRVAQP